MAVVRHESCLILQVMVDIKDDSGFNSWLCISCTAMKCSNLAYHNSFFPTAFTRTCLTQPLTKFWYESISFSEYGLGVIIKYMHACTWVIAGHKSTSSAHSFLSSSYGSIPSTNFNLSLYLHFDASLVRVVE